MTCLSRISIHIQTDLPHQFYICLKKLAEMPVRPFATSWNVCLRVSEYNVKARFYGKVLRENQM
jgi:hypothetical protein